VATDSTINTCAGKNCSDSSAHHGKNAEKKKTGKKGPQKNENLPGGLHNQAKENENPRSSRQKNRGFEHGVGKGL